MFLIDPPGSSLFNRVKRGVLYTCQEAEGRRLRNPFDTITEGIGINRITANFSLAQVGHGGALLLRIPVNFTGPLAFHPGPFCV